MGGHLITLNNTCRLATPGARAAVRRLRPFIGPRSSRRDRRNRSFADAFLIVPIDTCGGSRRSRYDPFRKVGPNQGAQMSATPDSTFTNPEQRIADLQRQLAECRAERDEALGERDEAQQRLAERTAERDEALEQQTATGEVLQVINASPGDLAPVFDAILEKALGLCEAKFGNITTYDGEAFHFAAAAGHPEFAEFLSREAVRPNPVTGWGRIAAGEQFVHIVDLAAEQAYKDREPLRVATVELAGARTCIFVPLVKDNAILGVLTAYRREVLPFSDKQIALLQNFAAQAVIAMENARLLTETRETLEQQTATAEVLQVINSSPGDLAPVFDVMLDKALRLCEAPYGHIWRMEDGQTVAGQAVAVR